jgi:putative DNA primase/helicase
LPVLLQAGDRVVLIDNVEGQSLCSAKLAMCLTQIKTRHRILGHTAEMRCENRAVFIATGNNLTFKGDLAKRRALMISLDPNCENPDRNTFDFDPVARARELYPQLVVAGLTALHAFILAGMPRTQMKRDETLGSFEAWEKLVRQCYFG